MVSNLSPVLGHHHRCFGWYDPGPQRRPRPHRFRRQPDELATWSEV